MSTGAVQVIILCEDQQQECFIRRFLMLRGYDRRSFSPQLAPAGRGSAEQFVRERLPKEILACRSRNTRAATCLVVCMDADVLSVDDRVKSLTKACSDAGVPFRQEGERVLFAIPKRNIETWLAYLRGETVDEQTKYPKYDCPSDCQADVECLDEMCRRQNLQPKPPPPSLLFACEEFKRFQFGS